MFAYTPFVQVYGVAISPEGTLVASAGNGDKLFLLVEITSGRQLYTFTHTTFVTSPYFI